MSKMICKVALRGEGKTKWLLDVAHRYSDSAFPVYFFTTKEDQYRKFCEKYFRAFQSICTVEEFNIENFVGNEIILVDDLMSLDIDMKKLSGIKENCYKMYATIEGTTEADIVTDTDQLTISDTI